MPQLKMHTRTEAKCRYISESVLAKRETIKWSKWRSPFPKNRTIIITKKDKSWTIAG
jgi:hypothetical protein